jgi:hypothetical protein
MPAFLPLAGNQVIVSVLSGIAMLYVLISAMRGWWTQAKLEGIREAVTHLSRMCSSRCNRNACTGDRFRLV